nr:MAG TPA: hypothetical protein [Caudoviricetes sp.]
MAVKASGYTTGIESLAHSQAKAADAEQKWACILL